jgi:hypothetical protein
MSIETARYSITYTPYEFGLGVVSRRDNKPITKEQHGKLEAGMFALNLTTAKYSLNMRDVHFRNSNRSFPSNESEKEKYFDCEFAFLQKIGWLVDMCLFNLKESLTDYTLVRTFRNNRTPSTCDLSTVPEYLRNLIMLHVDFPTAFVGYDIVRDLPVEIFGALLDVPGIDKVLSFSSRERDRTPYHIACHLTQNGDKLDWGRDSNEIILYKIGQMVDLKIEGLFTRAKSADDKSAYDILSKFGGCSGLLSKIDAVYF